MREEKGKTSADYADFADSEKKKVFRNQGIELREEKGFESPSADCLRHDSCLRPYGTAREGPGFCCCDFVRVLVGNLTKLFCHLILDERLEAGYED